MATPARASQALLFMQHCRRSSLLPVRLASTTLRHSSSSPYAPSNFTRPSKPNSSPFSPSDASSTSPAPQSDASPLPVPRPTYAHPSARHAVPPIEIPVRLTPWTWLKSLFGWRPTPAFKPAPFRAHNNPYRARKKWPPDFRNLDPKQQFHFEKTYRRRAILKWARPTWNKSIKILQQTLITFTIIYFVFIYNPDHGMGTPFDGVCVFLLFANRKHANWETQFRVWFFDKLGKLGQLPDSTREEADRLSGEAKQRMKGSDDTSNSPVAS